MNFKPWYTRPPTWWAILLLAAMTGKYWESRANAGVGATTPFISVEAESGRLAGGAAVRAMAAPAVDQFTTPEIESSGRAFVELKGPGQSVTWTNLSSGNYSALNLRFSIPDAPNGGGTTATLNLYVDGIYRQSLLLSSAQIWLYENAADYNSNNQSPTNGHPHLFFDETHCFINGAPVAPGSRITLQQDATNAAAFYWLDVVDWENPPAALDVPANSLSILTYGAVANDPNFDSTVAIQNCFNACQQQGKTAWIPPGKFYLKTTAGLNATGITIAGAGRWYSTLYRQVPLPNATPLGPILALVSCTARDLSLDANAPSRSMEDGDGGGVDANGVNWLMENLWIQHTMSGFWAAGINGVVRHCRMGNTWGDGVNLNNVSLGGPVGINLRAYNNFVRGAGDDGVTINSVNTNDTTRYVEMSNTSLSNNTCIAIWWAHGVGVYGGSNDVVYNNLVLDPAKFTGIVITEFGENGSTLDSAWVEGNVVIRGGGNGHNQQQPAFSVGGSSSRPYIANATIISNTIIAALFSGVGIESCSNVVLQGNTIVAPRQHGITVAGGQVGTAILQANKVTGLGTGWQPVTNSSSVFELITPTPAINFTSQSGVATEDCAEGGGNVTGIENGDWTAYGEMDLTGMDIFVARVAGASFGGNLEIHLDRPDGTLIGTCAVAGTGGFQTFANVYCRVTAPAGRHAVCLVYAGGGGRLFNVEYFGFFAATPAVSHQLVAGNVYALKSKANGKYVSAANGGTNALVAQSTAIGPAEQFEVVSAGGANIGLLARVNTNYVCAESGGASPLIANRAAIGAWETFAELDVETGGLALRAQINSKYVSVPNGGAAALLAQSSTIGTNETFIVEFVSGVPPEAPTGLTAVGSSGSEVTLVWPAVSGAASYNVKRSLTNGGPYSIVAAGVAATTCHDGHLLTGTNYYYVVSAQNPAGESSNSAPVSVLPGGLDRTGWLTTASATEANGSPARAIDGDTATRWTTGVVQAAGQWFQVDMGATNTIYRVVLDTSGSASDYPRGYQVKLSNDGTNWGNPVATGAGAVVTSIGFTSQAVRYVRVIQTGNSGPWWSIHELNIFGTAGLPAATPPAPLAVVKPGQAILTWDLGATITGYNLKRSLTAGGTYTTIATNLAALGFTDTGLTNGTVYYYVLSALNPAGESGNSVPVRVQPVSLAAVPLQAAVISGQLQLAWPQDHRGWSLQVQTNLAGAGLGTNWWTVSGSSATNAMMLPVSSEMGSCFYRLVYP